MAFSVVVVVVLLQLLLCCCSCCCTVVAAVDHDDVVAAVCGVFFCFLASHTSHLFPCWPTVGVARIFNLLIELARASFQRV